MVIKVRSSGVAWLLGYSAYKHISEAVVGEGGSVDFYSAALADVSVGLTVVLGLKMGGLVAELPVYKKLAVAECDLLTGLTVDFKAAYPASFIPKS